MPNQEGPKKINSARCTAQNADHRIAYVAFEHKISLIPHQPDLTIAS